MTDRPGRFFTWAEFVQASSAPLTAQDRRAIRRMCAAYLDPLRERFGPVTVWSAKRSRSRNQAVGGAPRSWHLYDLRPGHAAADVSCARGTPREWDRWLQVLGQPWVEHSPTHSHVDTRGLRI